MTDAKRMNLASIDFRQRLPSRKEYFWQKLEKGVYIGYRSNNATWHRGHGRENGLGKTGTEVALGKAIQLSSRTRGPVVKRVAPPTYRGGYARPRSDRDKLSRRTVSSFICRRPSNLRARGERERRSHRRLWF